MTGQGSYITPPSPDELSLSAIFEPFPAEPVGWLPADLKAAQSIPIIAN
jgi:hypothetical protein